MQMNSQIKSLGKQAGYTLIELSIAIAIISVLVMTALFGVQKILDNSKADTTAQQVTLANANISKYSTMLSDTTFLGTAGGGAGLGIWPDNIVTKGGTVAAPTYSIKNPFGGLYIVGAAGTGYFIGITGVTQNACMSIAASLGTAAQTIDTDEATTYTAATTAMPTIAAGSGNVKTLTAAATGTTLAAGCAPSAGGKKKNIWLTYTL